MAWKSSSRHHLETTRIMKSNHTQPDLLNLSRIEKVQDLVLYRYGSTGVQDVVLKAVEVLGLVPAFPVKSLTTFANTNGKGVFRDCVLLWSGTTVIEFADIVHPEIAKHYLGAETIGNRKVSFRGLSLCYLCVHFCFLRL